MQTYGLQRENLSEGLLLLQKPYPPPKKVQIIDWKEFAKAALDPNKEAFVVHVATINAEPMIIYPARKAQIALLKADEAPVTIPVKYSDFSNVFSEKSAAELQEHTKMNTHAIDLEEGKQPLYGPIYRLGPIELEILKTYIKINLANGFICSSKSPTGTPIPFDQKPNRSLRLCVDYKGLNNLTIKNRYPLPLIRESLDQLGRAKRFTQMDLTSAYHWMRIKEGNK